MTSPLQNRVDPYGCIHAVPNRGTMFGNRGGRFHNPATQSLSQRRWHSRQWICCVLEFKNRRRTLMTQSYTELFFLDEITALAAGHRPCFECRRKSALAYQAAWQIAGSMIDPPKAPEMDKILHEERLNGKYPKTWEEHIEQLPPGATIKYQNKPYALLREYMLPWSFEGYGLPVNKPTGRTTVLTPPSTIAVLKHGYKPQWHRSAKI
ncbi:MAG: hypothetical protein COB90_02560 [Hyphomicrobiales bacterium]|nr:MAG: hypothetical protein COB90_02560 [Hyphomicrobiales bacterium]